MKIMFKRAGALLTALAMLLSSPQMIFAQASEQKSEVVYAKMQADGAVSDVLVVNGFEKNPGDLVDYGSYDEVINLTNADALQKAGDRVEIDSKQAPFYYQGKMRDAQLPWEIAIRYQLDGKEMKAEEIVGKTGELTVEIQVKKNAKANKAFAQNYLLQMMVNLDGSRFDGIQAENGTVASQGATKLVTFTLMPDKEETFTVTAHGTNIELGMIQIAGMPFSMEFEVPDLSEYTGELVQLQDAIGQLTDGVGEFTNGVGSVYDATGKLRSGAGELSSAAYTLSEGLAKFSGGMSDYEKGLAQYVQALEQGVGSMASNMPSFDTGGLDALVNGSVQLSGGIKDFDTALNNNLGSSSEFAQGLDAVTAGAQQLAGGFSTFANGDGTQPGMIAASTQIQKALTEISSALSGGMPSIDTSGLDQLSSGLSQLSAGLTEYLGALDQALASADPAAMQGLIEALGTLRDTMTHTVYVLRNPEAEGIDFTTVTPETNPEAYALLGIMQERAAYLEPQIATVEGAISALTQSGQMLAGMQSLRDATAKMLEGIQSASGQLSGIDPAAMMGQMGPLISGIQQLSTQYNAFHGGLVEGLSKLSAGIDNPSQTTPGLVQGLTGLQSGYKQLSQGLIAGSAALVPGAAQLSAGIATMAERLGSLASEMDFSDDLNQLINGSKSLLSGHRELLTGAQSLNSGMRDYADGVKSYANGMIEFQNGMLRLANGGDDLASGMQTLRDETGGMDQQMQERMDEVIDEFMPKDFKPVSFASAKNPAVQSVQFVYMTEGVKAPKAEEPVIEPEEPKGIIEKILDLFR